MAKGRAGGRSKGPGGAPRRPSGGGGRGRKSSAAAYDDADRALKLHEDDEASDGDRSEDDGCDDEVMAFEQPEDDDYADAGADDVDEAEASGQQTERKRGSVTSGWSKNDFYGGEDAGDDSSGGSDEELVLEEARKLEEVRAARLQGSSDDVLGSLIGTAPAAADAAEAASVGAGETVDAAAAGAQFEALFAADAERGTVERDLSRLSDTKKRSIMKKEAPELLPLLEDFKAKLAGLKELLPLLAPATASKVPASGNTYLRAKASLLLNTLTNLSFYLLIRAEGGEVRAHPVVSQLVWLRELHDKLAPLDKRLGKRLRKATNTLAKLGEDAAPAAPSEEEDGGPDLAVEATPPKRLSVKERLEQLRRVVPKSDVGAAAAGKGEARTARANVKVSDLLRLPAKKKAVRKGAGDSLDLEEADPSLGFRRVGASLGEQVSSVRQLLGERAAREKVASADGDVEARPRRVRERPSAELMPELDAGAPGDEELGGLGEEDEILGQARARTRAKKARKAGEMDAKEKERVAQQFRPEEVIDGRRKTSKQILKNRGLVRQRKRTAGNARVTNRAKYEKLVKRRKGAVQDMREGATDGASYAGEATGVRTHLRKSLKLG